MKRLLRWVFENILLATALSIAGGFLSAYLLGYPAEAPERGSTAYTITEMERLGIWIDTVSHPDARLIYQIPEERQAAAVLSKDQLSVFVVQCEGSQAIMWIGQWAGSLPTSHPIQLLDGISTSVRIPFELRFSDGSVHELFAFGAPGRIAAGTLLPKEIVAAFMKDNNQFTVYIFETKAGSFIGRGGASALRGVFRNSACSHVFPE
jgi:hypothetical protein